VNLSLSETVLSLRSDCSLLNPASPPYLLSAYVLLRGLPLFPTRPEMLDGNYRILHSAVDSWIQTRYDILYTSTSRSYKASHLCHAQFSLNHDLPILEVQRASLVHGYSLLLDFLLSFQKLSF